jgi:penicillin-binding protein 2
MYEKRIKVLIGVSLAVLLACLVRLGQMQVFPSSKLQAEMTRATELPDRSKQLKTLRGKILDRHHEILAADMPQFQICINYRTSCFRDARVPEPTKFALAHPKVKRPSSYQIRREVEDKRQDLERIIEKCTHFGPTQAQVEGCLKALNDGIWNARTFLCWARNDPDPNVIAHYGGVSNVPGPRAVAELERKYPDSAQRNKAIVRVPLGDLGATPRDAVLVDLKTEDDVFTAQMELLEFTDANEVQILPTGRRYYPFRSTAAQTIGWVGGATQRRDVEAFAEDPLASYRAGEVCGREDGIEYVCESILRGRRGEVVHDRDGQLVRQTETEFGQDVQLTLDIDLQKQIEERLTDPKLNQGYSNAPMSGVVLDIRSGDILALISLPSYDLNAVRRDYDKLQADPNHPMTNRALHQRYPPGSVAKPVVLVAGLETGAITPDEVIPCPAADPPTGWPRCLIWWKAHSGHDLMWRNNARNATKGSCNIYFSHVADRIDSLVLQEWLYRFGYGHEAPLACPVPPEPGMIPRRLRQCPGDIGSRPVSAATNTESFDEIPPLEARDRKMFGIGQSNFRVTPLQVANAFATLARGGQVKAPRLFLSPESAPSAAPVKLPIASTTLDVVRDGMYAVVNEHGGTAYQEFVNSGLAKHGVKVYGKTGSTEKPFDAWFAAFAEDGEGPKIALALVIEGGQHGGTNAGPLAREILKLCVEAGYLGNRTAGTAEIPSTKSALAETPSTKSQIPNKF